MMLSFSLSKCVCMCESSAVMRMLRGLWRTPLIKMCLVVCPATDSINLLAPGKQQQQQSCMLNVQMKSIINQIRRLVVSGEHNWAASVGQKRHHQQHHLILVATRELGQVPWTAFSGGHLSAQTRCLPSQVITQFVDVKWAHCTHLDCFWWSMVLLILPCSVTEKNFWVKGRVCAF